MVRKHSSRRSDVSLTEQKHRTKKPGIDPPYYNDTHALLLNYNDTRSSLLNYNDTRSSLLNYLKSKMEASILTMDISSIRSS